MNSIFWDVVDEAQQTRSRLRFRRELTRLAERETAQYERLSHMGFELLHDGIGIERTPETSQVLTEIDRLQAEQHELLARPDAKHLQTATPFPWHRLEKVLHTGEWVIHVQTLPDSSPWCGRPMIGRPAAGLCLAFKRGYSVEPFTPDTICLGGDLLLILSPAANVSDWDRWMLQGSSSQASEGW
jgi:hypothetical protein